MPDKNEFIARYMMSYLASRHLFSPEEDQEQKVSHGSSSNDEYAWLAYDQAIIAYRLIDQWRQDEY